MQHSEIITYLSNITANPSEVIYAVTMQDVLSAIARRMGEEVLTLSSKDLQLAREEVQETIVKFWGRNSG